MSARMLKLERLLPGARTRGMLSLVFVGLSLIALAGVPAYLGSVVASEQEHINEVLHPASNLSSRLSLLKSRQMARFEGFVLSGDGSFRLAYAGAIEEEDQVFRNLSDLASELDLEVRERLADLSVRTTAWHLENQLVFAEIDPIERARALERSRATFRELQRATSLLDDVIQARVREGRRRMASSRELQSRLTLGLAGLALLATLGVGRVGQRLRRLTFEAEARRGEAVRARREIDAILEATGDGVLGMDLEGRCISLNRAGGKLLGLSERDVRGRPFHDVLHHTREDGTPRTESASPILAAVARGESADSVGVDVLWRADGTPLPVKWALRPLVDGTELRGAVLTFTDMTQIRRKEAELREAIRQREDVVSIVSHDLRNPLGVVFGATDILLELPLDEEGRKRQAEIIGRAAQRMSNLIEDLLDVARIEDGALVVRRALENVNEIIQEAAALFRQQAEAKDLVFRIESDSEPIYARIDRDRLLQALSNLLDNAIRLTPEGGTVRIDAKKADGRIRIRVVDTGIGIARDEIEHLFDRFWQREDGSRRSGGLGLTIVKGVVEAHGGEIEVRSEPGVGTTFALFFAAAHGPGEGDAGE